jgi:acyl transferase domain-containing protein/glutamate-1-semialdehyde aminotransferase
MGKVLSRSEICDLILKEIRICIPNFSSEDISFEKGFLEMGIESLQAVNIIDGLVKELKIPLDVTALFDKPNLNALTDYILEVLVQKEMKSSVNPQSDSAKVQQVLLGSVNTSIQEQIAIVGMSCRFPGAKNLNEYFDILSKGVCAIQRQSHQRWESLNEDSINFFGALSDVENFAADVFGISDAEAQSMDPQQRMLLEEVWAAIEDSGVSPLSLRGSEAGVYVGISSHDYSYKVDSMPQKNIFSITGNSQSIAANRISYFYDLRGPSLAIDTACSSSLVALDSAVKALKNNEIEIAIVAGANLLLKADLSRAFKEATMLSPDGLCKTFSSDANGYVRGEGVGVIILKRTSDALKLNHRIYAEILAVAVNQDGKSSSLTAPNGTAQESVIKKALSRAQIESSEVVFHEAHGTGTTVGDPIEGLALERVHKERELSVPLLVSSVKTNIGHLEAAAGIAGLIKVALSIYHRSLFPSLHFKALNPLLENKIPHLKVLTRFEKYLLDRRLVGSISSFGFGGTNAHAILSESAKPQVPNKNLNLPLSSFGFGGFSSNEKKSLLASIKELRERIASAPWSESQLILKSTLAQRMNLQQQILFYGSSKESLLKTLDDAMSGTLNPQYRWCEKAKSNLKVALLFTGQGSQFTGMFRDLYATHKVFKQSVDAILFQAQKYFPLNLTQVWIHDSLENELHQTNYSQILIFACEYSLARILVDSYRLKFDFVFGHSLGEIVAATIAGSLDLAQAIELVCRRGWFMSRTQEGAMLAVFATLEKTRQLIADSELPLDLAAMNGPELQIVSGPVVHIEAFQTILKAHPLRSQRLAVKQAFHSALMDEILEPFAEALGPMKFQVPDKKLVSSLTGRPFADDAHFSVEYWQKQLRQPTQFHEAMNYLAAERCQVYIEVGPKAVLTGMAQKFNSNEKAQWISLADQNSFAMGVLTLSQLKLFAEDPFAPTTSTVLPKTVMKKSKYWISGGTGSMEKKETLSIDTILRKLVEIISTTMRVPIQEINVDESLIDFGADSLVLLNAVQAIKDTYQVSIPISEVFKDLSTLRKIADYISIQTQGREAFETSTSVSSLPLPPALPATAESLEKISTVGGGDLMSLLNSQLEIMRNQIELLRSSSEAPLQAVSIPKSVSVPTEALGLGSLGAEKRGVLGNFKSFATTERTEEDHELKGEFLRKTISSVTQMTRKTKQHVQTYRKCLADNRVSAGFRPNTKEMIYPIHCYKAKGSQFIDLDGNTFIDFTMGFGVNLFGHSPEFLNEAMKDQFELGICVGPQSHLAGKVADLFCQLTGHERVAFVNSGTEAVMTALRLARAATGRSKIVLFDGSYHGHFDGVLAKGTKNLTSTPVAAGITQNMVNDILVLEYGNPQSLEIIRKHAFELAAVLVEPVQSRFPELQPQEFLKDIRKITEDQGVAFIWDEVITGFRISPGGAQEYFGIKADLAAYGKILGGGLPIGAVGGSSKYLDFIDGGYWEFGNDSLPENEMTFFAGTFSKHPLAMATALATLKKLQADGQAVIRDLNLKTNGLVEKLNCVFVKRNLDVKVFNFGSLFRFKGNLNLDLLFAKLLEKGFYIWEGRNCFISTAHTKEELELFISAVDKSCEELQNARFYPQNSSMLNDKKFEVKKVEIELSPFQKRFVALQRQGGAAAAANNICVSAKVKGFLDVSKLRQAIEFISERRDIFKWNYSPESEKQSFQSATKPVNFEFIDLRSIQRPWKILDKQLQDLSSAEFDLERQSPMLIKVYDVVEETHLLAVIVHHMAFDGWSMTLFFEDLATVYNALIKGLEPKLRSAYSFAELLQSKTNFPKIAKETLIHRYKDLPPSTLFASNEHVESDYKGERIVFDVELEVYSALKRWCKQSKVTPFMLLLAGFAKVLMSQYQKTTMTLGIPAANRDVMGTEVMYGNCANLVPVTLDNTEDSILKFVFQVKEKMIEGYQTMSYPYELLKQETGPLFDVYFNLEPTSDLPKFDDASLLIYPFRISSSEFPLMLNVTDFEHYYHCEMDFQVGRLSDDEVLKIIEIFKKKLRQELVVKNQGTEFKTQ